MPSLLVETEVICLIHQRTICFIEDDYLHLFCCEGSYNTIDNSFQLQACWTAFDRLLPGRIKSLLTIETNSIELVRDRRGRFNDIFCAIFLYNRDWDLILLKNFISLCYNLTFDQHGVFSNVVRIFSVDFSCDFTCLKKPGW